MVSIVGIWLKIDHVNGSVQERCNSSASAMELRFSCANPHIDVIVGLSSTWNLAHDIVFHVQNVLCYLEALIFVITPLLSLY